MRWPALVVGIALVGVAFIAGARVADTRNGLIAEVITLLGGLAGVCLILYGLFATSYPQTGPPNVRRSAPRVTEKTQMRSANDLLLGAAGVLVAAILIVGLAINVGPLGLLLGIVLLSPMLAGCGYLCVRFVRAPAREWRIDLARLTRLR